jgi:hypothetical protein
MVTRTRLTYVTRTSPVLFSADVCWSASASLFRISQENRPLCQFDPLPSLWFRCCGVQTCELRGHCYRLVMVQCLTICRARKAKPQPSRITLHVAQPASVLCLIGGWLIQRLRGSVTNCQLLSGHKPRNFIQGRERVGDRSLGGVNSITKSWK